MGRTPTLTLAICAIGYVLSTQTGTFPHMTDTAPLSYRIPAQLKEDLKKLADADRRKLGPYLLLVLEEHVAEQKAAAKKGRSKRK